MTSLSYSSVTSHTKWRSVNQMVSFVVDQSAFCLRQVVIEGALQLPSTCRARLMGRKNVQLSHRVDSHRVNPSLVGWKLNGSSTPRHGSFWQLSAIFTNYGIVIRTSIEHAHYTLSTNMCVTACERYITIKNAFG